MGHIPSELAAYLRPYLYHMPLFFLVGGVVSKGNFNSVLIKKTIQRYYLYIIYTYFIISFIVLGIQMNSSYEILSGEMFQEKFFRTLKSAIVGNFHTSTYALTLWFVYAYSFVYILGNYAIHVLKKKEYIVALALTTGYIGNHVLSQAYSDNKQQIFNLSSQVLTGMMFYLIGYVLKDKLLNIKYSILVPFLATFYLIKYEIFTESTMSWSNYPNDFTVFLFCTLTICGSFFLLSKWITYLPLSNLLVLIGKHSKIIMSYHLITFLLLDLVYSQSHIIKVFPDAPKTINMAIIYSIFGVALPLLMGLIVDRLKKYCSFSGKLKIFKN